MKRFLGKNVLITGGTSGMGKAGALRVVEEGGAVIVTGRNTDRIEEMKTLLREPCLVLGLDSSSSVDISEMTRAVERIGGIDGLWINAGIASLDDIDNKDLDAFDRMISVNMKGPRLLVSEILPFMRENSSIVVTSSSSAYEGAPVTSEYAATKSALIAMVRSWATALGPKGIRVNSLVPGPIETNFRSFLPEIDKKEFEKFVLDQVPLKRIGTAQEAAAVALFLLSDDSSYVTGSQFAVDGGLVRY